MHDRILKIVGNLDLSKSVTREQLFRSLISLVGNEFAEMSDIELEEKLKKVLPQFEKLRPPGAVTGLDFFLTCEGPSGCRACVDACESTTRKPIIKIQPSDDQWWGGTPYIDPPESGCLLCEGFPCAASCPSGSLVVPASIQAVAMGHAVIDMARCTSSTENPCTECVASCPDMIKALLVERNCWISVSNYLCVGCGQCVKGCPHDPSAIVVFPW
jgi:ferredoxin-type protein NapG